MSSLYYQQKWEEAISELLECVDQENHPLDENRNDKGVPPPSSRSPTKEPTTNGSSTTANSTSATCRPTANSKTPTIRWYTPKNASS